MTDQMRMIVAVGLCVAAFMLPKLEGVNVIPDIGGPKVREVLQVPEPSANHLAMAQNQMDVTNTQDKLELCVFTFEFANRVPQYDTSVQKLQDTYAEAAKTLFGTRLNDSTPKIDNLVGSEALRSVLGDADGFVKAEERQELSKQFNAKAWVLGD